MSFTILTKEEFQTHISQAKEKSFLQSLEMAELYTKRGFEALFLGLKKNDQIKVAALAYKQKMFGGYLMSIDSGPVYTDSSYLSEFYQELKTFVQNNQVFVLQIKPYEDYQLFDTNGEPTSEEKTELITQLTQLGYKHAGLYTGYPNGEASWTYVKDLSSITSDKLISSFSKKGKPLIKKAKSFGTQIRPLKRDELQIFKDITASTSDRRSFTDKPLQYYEDFYDSFGDSAEFMVATINFQTYANQVKEGRDKIVQDLAEIEKQLEDYPDSAKWKKKHQEVSKQLTSFDKRLEEAQDFVNKYQNQDVVVAGALFIYTPQESYYLFSGSYTEFNTFYAPALLQEHAMLKSIERNIPAYNFLGIAGIFDGSDGVVRFKQNFNGHITRKMGEFRYYPNPLKFQFIQFLKKILRR